MGVGEAHRGDCIVKIRQCRPCSSSSGWSCSSPACWMGLTSHLEGVLNGMFLAVVGLLWPHVHLPHAWGVTAVVLIVYSAFANWLGTLLAAAWGAGRKLAPIAAGDHEASKVKEIVFGFLVVSLSVAVVIGVVIVIVGL